ncbi:GldG family protein [Candidatus Poribacteria bacterium]|nr:GldG family protein [Candidatus Poribacteria bacterium]
MRRLDRSERNLAPLIGFGAGLVLTFMGLAAFLSVGFANAWPYVLLALAVGAVGGSAVLFRTQTARILASRSATYGALVTLSVLLVVGIVVILNIYASSLLDIQFDFTEEKFHTLSEQSVKVVRGLDAPVAVIGFFTTNANDFRYQDRVRAQDLLTLYRRAADGNFTFELVDPYTNPTVATKYGVDYESTVVFETADRRETTTTVTETEFTATLLKLTRDEMPKVYFLTGHDERLIDDSQQTGYYDAGEALQRQNYIVAPLALRQQSPVRVPSDAAAVVMAGPRLTPDASEISALDTYAKNGGRVMVLIDPPNERLDAVRRWLRRWGIEVGNDIVIDVMNHAYDEATMPVGQFEPHQITESFRRRSRSAVFRLACSVREATGGPEGRRDEPLVQTTESETAAWGETDFENPPRFEPGDLPGPVTFGIASAPQAEDAMEASKTGARFVVIGDSDFASNALFALGGGDLFLNAINWLTLQEDLISIPPKDAADRLLAPTMSRAEGFMLIGVTMLFMPLVVTVIGVAVWIRRR